MANKKIAKFISCALLGALICGNVNSVETFETKAETNQIKTAISTIKVTQDESIDNLTQTELKISAAKGEKEGGQIILRAEKDVANYDVTVSDLTCGENVISKDNIEVLVEIYTYATERSYASTLPDGMYPDALIPIKYIKNKGENKISANKNQAFFIDVDVPEDAVAGVYTGSVKVVLDGEEKSVPMTFEVYDFEMPESPAVRSCYLIWQDWLIDGELDNTTEKYIQYYETLLEYNISAQNLPNRNIDEYISNLRKYGRKLASFSIPYQVTVNRYTLDTNYLYRYLDAVARASVEDNVNYFEKAYYYFDVIYDEPHASADKMAVFENTLRKTDSVEEQVINALVSEGVLSSVNCDVANSMRAIHHVVPGLNSLDGIAKDLSVDPCYQYIVLSNTKNIEKIKAAAKEGYKLSSYGCVMNDTWPYPSNEINDFAITTRDMFWKNYEYGIDGELLWNVNAYVNINSTSGLRYGRVEDLYTTASRDAITNGDGYMLYPGLAYGSEYPFGSIRLVAKRDGIDDFTYLSMLEDLYVAAGYSTDNLVTFINETLFGRGASKLNYDGVTQSRELVADLIVAAQNGFFVTNIETQNSEIAYELASNTDCQVSVNSVSVAMNNNKATGKVVIADDRKFVISYATSLVNGELVFNTSTPRTLLNGFETTTDVEKVVINTQYGSSVALNTNSRYATDGNSLKVTIAGHYFATNAMNISFKPRFEMPVDFTQNKAVRFRVYNSGETLEAEVIMNGSLGVYSYDKVVLEKGKWTEIVIDNPLLVNLNGDISAFNSVGLRFGNFLNGTKAYSVDLYVDSLYVSK